MKKQHLKSLALNKKSISNLRVTNIHGGGTRETLWAEHCQNTGEDPRTGATCVNDSSLVNCPQTCIFSVSDCTNN